jgi:hypothetical protein
VALVVGAELLPCGAERLAWERSSPEIAVFRDASKSESKGPSEYAAEEMALDESLNFVRSNICNGSAVNLSVRDKFAADKLSSPFTCFWIEVIVVIPLFHIYK